MRSLGFHLANVAGGTPPRDPPPPLRLPPSRSRSSLRLSSYPPPPLRSQPPLDDNYSEALAAFFPTEAAGMPLERAVAQAGGLPLRTEAARHDSAWTWSEPMLGELPVELADAKA